MEVSHPDILVVRTGCMTYAFHYRNSLFQTVKAWVPRALARMASYVEVRRVFELVASLLLWYIFFIFIRLIASDICRSQGQLNSHGHQLVPH